MSYNSYEMTIADMQEEIDSINKGDKYLRESLEEIFSDYEDGDMTTEEMLREAVNDDGWKEFIVEMLSEYWWMK